MQGGSLFGESVSLVRNLNANRPNSFIASALRLLNTYCSYRVLDNQISQRSRGRIGHSELFDPLRHESPL